MASEDWDEERIALLKRLWAEGITAPAIGQRLGLSRSAVLGKIFRLRQGAAASGKPPKAQSAANTLPIARRNRSRTESAPAAPSAPAKVQGKTLMELTNTCCRWPYRRPGTHKYFFCGAAGADLDGGLPYCASHMKRAYLVPPPLPLAPARRRQQRRTQ
jgi:GcrA cell cycle regulator